MADAEYYVQAIERALSLLQMGWSSRAQVILRDALAQRLKSHPAEVLESGMPDLLGSNLELPKCWVDEESQNLVIDDRGWKIDPAFSEYLKESVKVWKDPILKLDRAQIEKRAATRIRKGLLEGYVRRQL